MNLKTNGLIKLALVSAVLFSSVLFAADQLTVLHEVNRFLDADGNTVYHFNYKIPNNELTFVQSDDGYLATVDVTISTVDEEGEEKVINEFSHYIGVRDINTARSRTHYYLDKISLALSKADFDFIIEFKDRASEDIYRWVEKLENLEKKALVSDLEFSHRILRSELRPGLEKFQRGEVQFYVDPAHIYQRSINDTIFLYYEIQNLYPAGDEFSYVQENIRIYNEDYSSTISNTLRGTSTIFDRIIKIPADTLSTGYYSIDVEVTDLVSYEEAKTTDYFVVSDRVEISQRLFPNIDDEYRLLRYFLPSSHFRNWESMSDTARRGFIDRFWSINDPNPQTVENDFLQAIRERVSIANQRYTHFAEGWQTDRGRIYVRNGEPSEIESDTVDTGIDAKLLRREYQIWRYRDINRVYLFLDMQGNGNYRLVFSRNDDMEQNTHDWERLMGEEFDMNKLQ